jgi:beta-lysine N6-acetyltransferase
MDLLAQSLVERFGEHIGGTRELYSLQLGGAGARPVETQYDPYNRRLKFFDLTPADVRGSTLIASALGEKNGDTAHGGLYSKVIVYARPGHVGWSGFGLHHEATIWGFFGDGSHAELWAAYPEPARAEDQLAKQNDKVYEIASNKQCTVPTLPEGYSCGPALPEDASEIAELMDGTFNDYPTPIAPDVVAGAIDQKTSHFRVARDGRGRIAACASAEIHHTRKSAELTDCATRTDERGKGIMSAILRGLEHDLQREFNITDVYTIARAVEPGMNCSFAKLGYTYTGRLVNNCKMPEGFESMNVWCRDTRQPVEVA